jgi:hypothetical protein
MEVVQQVEDYVARGGDEVVVSALPVAVHRHRAAALREEGCREVDVQGGHYQL